jgi:lipopolysaccharide transport system ATP-binding protein
MKKLTFDLQNVGVCYRKAASFPWEINKFWALHDVSLQVYCGETLCVIGRNGAGKSTLLKVFAGIIRPDTGTITRADVTVTMQSIGAGFDPRLTGRQNILLNGLLLGMDKKQISQRVNEIIELADIGDFIDEPVKHYSSGMRARLGFSIAYYVDTDVILIDEVFAVGDQAFKEKASKLIKEKIKSDYTVVLVTHSMAMVRELCNRVIQIEDGRLLPELPVGQTIARYLDSRKKDNYAKQA